MGISFRKRKKAVEVIRYDGPGARAGDECAYFNIYVFEDETCRTVEFDKLGRHLAEYDGEPQFPDGAQPEPLPEGVPPKGKKSS